MKERSILILKGGDCTTFADVLRFVSDQCKAKGTEAFVRNIPEGYEIYERWEEAQPQAQPQVANSGKGTICKFTVKLVREFLASLPEEYQNAEFFAQVGPGPKQLKRIVAYRTKDGTEVGVVANPMGTHLPFDDTYKWECVLRLP